MGHFKLTNAAKKDVKGISAYTEEIWGRNQRNAYLKLLDERFQKIALNPDIGKPCDYVKPGYRKISEGSHMIFYKTSAPQFVDIIRILHKNMDVDDLH